MYAVAALALVIPAVVWGAFLNSLLLFSRDSAFLYTLLDDPLWFVSGVRLPLFAMPLAIKAVGLAFPLTSSLAVLRGALLDGETLSGVATPLGGRQLTAEATPPEGMGSRAVHRDRKSGPGSPDAGSQEGRRLPPRPLHA